MTMTAPLAKESQRPGPDSRRPIAATQTRTTEAQRRRLLELVAALTEKKSAVELSLRREAELAAEFERLTRKLARNADNLDPLDAERFEANHREQTRASALQRARDRATQEREAILEPDLRTFFHEAQISDVLQRACSPLLDAAIEEAARAILPWFDGDRARARHVAREFPRLADAANFLRFTFCSVGDVAAASTAIEYLTALAEGKPIGPFI